MAAPRKDYDFKGIIENESFLKSRIASVLGASGLKSFTQTSFNDWFKSVILAQMRDSVFEALFQQQIPRTLAKQHTLPLKERSTFDGTR